MPGCESPTSRPRSATDDLGAPVELPQAVSRVVSLVPSLTESIAVTAPGLLVGATDWCTHPTDLQVPRIGGTKNPRLEHIVALAPDVVIANDEENREVDIRSLRARGLAVWVTAPRSVGAALESLDRMLTVCCGLPRPPWLDSAATAWSTPPPEASRRTAVVPIWRRPWMVLGCDTFAGDLLSRIGIDNAFASATERYPRLELAEIHRMCPELVLLPDEPYAFGWDDGPEAFADLGVAIACISGRHLTWYGPSLVDARETLLDQIAAARR
jgi:ABC-type Fe3+-hydroxamate transport system substrate-binding protein